MSLRFGQHTGELLSGFVPAGMSKTTSCKLALGSNEEQGTSQTKVMGTPPRMNVAILNGHKDCIYSPLLVTICVFRVAAQGCFWR